MNRNFKLILAVGMTAVLVGCGSNGSTIDPQRIANRNVEFDQYFTEIKADAAPAKPDEKGFIRRWTIIEPINKPNSGNTVFTDSYILAELTKEYFKGQFTNDINALPKTGDQVIVESEAPRAGGRGGFGGFGGGAPGAGQARPQGAPGAGQGRPQGAPQGAPQGQGRPQGAPQGAPQGQRAQGQRQGQRPGQQGQAQAPQMTKVPKYAKATKEEFYDSLRAHIFTVVNRYKDVVYCWDVVNEAMSDGNDPNVPYEQSFRQSTAYQLCGDEFILKAFQFAHEADPTADLFYNDYSAWTPAKRTYIYNMVKKLQGEGAPITGIGMQGHYNIYDNPTIEDFEKAIQLYLELVDNLQITEFDVRINHEAGGQLQFSRGEGQVLTDSIAQLQMAKYDELFKVLRKYKKNFSCVTFWNLGDRDSWLGANNFPLLFDGEYQRKQVYYTVRDFKK